MQFYGLAMRTIRDTGAVFRSASLPSACRWTVSALTNVRTVYRERSLRAADSSWKKHGAVFRTRHGPVVRLPGAYTAGAREMYCRNVYLRTGLSMPTSGWTIDLGANRGLFSVWAACAGAQAVAIEAQQDFEGEIRELALYNDVGDRVHIVTALIASSRGDTRAIGVLEDDGRWESATHAGALRPGRMTLRQILDKYDIDRVGLLKMDIEGAEFSVLSSEDDLTWLDIVDQIALEVHPDFGDAVALVKVLQAAGFAVTLCDNDGHVVAPTDETLNYLYCRRLVAASVGVEAQE